MEEEASTRYAMLQGGSCPPWRQLHSLDEGGDLMIQPGAAQQNRHPAGQQRPDRRTSIWYVSLLSLSMVIANAGYLLLASLLFHSWASSSPPSGNSSEIGRASC